MSESSVDGGELLAPHWAALAEVLRSRRLSVGWSQRETALAADVSFMTVGRVEDGAGCELVALCKLSAWLRLPPQQFLVAAGSCDTVATITAAFDADPCLDERAAAALSRVVGDMYAAAADAAPVAVVAHLRRGVGLRGGVAPRLAALLTDMAEGLRAGPWVSEPKPLRG